MDILNVSRPAEQAAWPLDGRSIVPLLRGNPMPHAGVGWWFFNDQPNNDTGMAYRRDTATHKWKFVHGSMSCTQGNCSQPQLYDLKQDLGETRDLAQVYPDVLAQIRSEFARFNASVQQSRALESGCQSPSIEPIYVVPW